MNSPRKSSCATAGVAIIPVEPKQVMAGDVVKMLSSRPNNQGQVASVSAHVEDEKTDGHGNAIQSEFPKGRNVSGRSWKVRPQKRASSLVKTRQNNQSKSWEARQAAKRAREEALELQNQLREEARQAAIDKKERRLENEKRRAENELKTVERSAQTLNLNKVGVTLKAMSKKQLRQIKKSRLNSKTGLVEYVPAYAK